MANSINFPTYGFADEIFAFTEENWRKFFKPFIYDSVQNGLETSAGSGMTVNISAGECRSGAVMGLLDNSVTLDIARGDSSYARIDSIAVQYQYGEPSTLSLVVVQGSPSASPIAPTLTKNFDSLWQMEIAQVEVPANATASSQLTITDTRIMVDISTITEEMDAIERDVDALEADVLSITTSIDALNSEIDSITTDVASLNSDVETIEGQILSVTTDVATLNTEVLSITTDMTSINEEIASITSDISSLESEVLSITTDVDNLENQILSITTDMDEMADEIASITSDIATLNTEVASITSDIDNLESEILSATTNISAITTDIASIDTEILSITTDIAGIDTKLGSLDDEILSITTDIVSLSTSKQDVLTFDSTPTASSTNPVTSGGVKSALDLKADLDSPEFSGVPTAPTAADGTNTTQIATTAFVQSAFKANDAMVFKGVVNSNADLPDGSTDAKKYLTGWTYKVGTEGIYVGQPCEIGDMIIANKDWEEGATASADWDIIQANIDGVVTGPTSATNTHVAIFNGNSGKVITDSGFTIEKSVPADAEFTDTTYTGSDGITLTGTNFTNSGVRAVASGTTNGTIKVNTNGTEGEVAVAGLKSAAYTESSDYATADHVHGNLSNGGAITSDTAVADGDKLVVTDASDSSKIIRSGVAFDGTTTTKALTPKGTWEDFSAPDHTHDNRYYTESEIDSALALKANLDSPALTGTPTAPTATKGTDTTQIATTAFVQAGLADKQDTLTFDDAPTANSDNPVTSDGIKTAIDNLDDSIQHLISDNIETSMVATKDYVAGDFLIVGSYLYKVTTSITSGGSITVGTNVVKTTIVEQLMKSRFLQRY